MRRVIEIIFVFLFFFQIDSRALADTKNKIFIQIDGKYLELYHAADKKGIKILKHNGTSLFIYKNKYYYINNDNIKFLFPDNQKLTLKFYHTYAKATIFLDNDLIGVTDNNGAKYYYQMYPKTGWHTIKVIKNSLVKKSKFNLQSESIFLCTGKRKLNCVKQSIN